MRVACGQESLPQRSDSSSVRMERAECAHHAAFSRCHAVDIRLALDEISYLDTTPLTGFGTDPLINIIEIGEEAMTLALWIVQILLALGFTLPGFGKVAQPVAKLLKQRFVQGSLEVALTGSSPRERPERRCLDGKGGAGRPVSRRRQSRGRDGQPQIRTRLPPSMKCFHQRRQKL